MTFFHSELIPRLLATRCGLWTCLVACFTSLSCLGFVGFVRAAEVDLTPVSSTDGRYNLVTIAGQTAWQNVAPDSRHLYARRPNSFGFTPGQTLYVRVTYLDDVGENMGLEYDSQTNRPCLAKPLHW